MANLELKTASGGSVTLVPQDGVSNVTATVKHESGVLASEAHADFVAGVGRTWQDVTASRNFDVVYTNTTGREISVAVRIVSGSTSATGIRVDGLNIGLGVSELSSNGGTVNRIVNVPDGSTYEIYSSFASRSISNVWELR